MKVSVEKEVVEKITSITIDVGGDTLTLNSQGVIGLEGCRNPYGCSIGEGMYTFNFLPEFTYKLVHTFGECEVTEEVYLNCLKMIGE